jgi:Uma2 family endonuclease
MAGGSPRHNALCANLIAALHGSLRNRGCVILSSDQRVGMGNAERYVYPDLTVVCGAVAIESGTSDVIANPKVVIEVLSGSTEKYDRGLKWEGYQRIASLTDYVLVSQSESRIEHFRREQADRWSYIAVGAGGQVVLSDDVRIHVDTVYDSAFQLPGD